jgi:hypothetical protein
MIGEVELVLLLARRIVLVVAVVGLHGDEALVASLHTLCGEVDGNGQIAAEVLFDESAVDIDPLLAHDGLEVDEYQFISHILRHCEVLAIPADTLIVAAATGLGGFQTVDVWGTDNLPSAVVEACGFSTFGIAKEEAPAFVEVIHDTSAALQWEEAGYRLRGSSE